MINALMIEKYAQDFMVCSKGGLDELVSGVSSVAVIRTAVDLYGKFHGFNSV